MGSCLEPCFYIHLSNYFEIYTSFTRNEIRMYKYLSANPMLFCPHRVIFSYHRLIQSIYCLSCTFAFVYFCVY